MVTMTPTDVMENQDSKPDEEHSALQATSLSDTVTEPKESRETKRKKLASILQYRHADFDEEEKKKFFEFLDKLEKGMSNGVGSFNLDALLAIPSVPNSTAQYHPSDLLYGLYNTINVKSADKSLTIIQSGQAHIASTPDKIEFLAIGKEGDIPSTFRMQDAMCMVLLAAQNKNLSGSNGLTINGSTQERRMLERAVRQYNEMMPDNKITVSNPLTNLEKAANLSFVRPIGGRLDRFVSKNAKPLTHDFPDLSKIVPEEIPSSEIPPAQESVLGASSMLASYLSQNIPDDIFDTGPVAPSQMDSAVDLQEEEQALSTAEASIETNTAPVIDEPMAIETGSPQTLTPHDLSAVSNEPVATDSLEPPIAEVAAETIEQTEHDLFSAVEFSTEPAPDASATTPLNESAMAIEAILKDDIQNSLLNHFDTELENGRIFLTGLDVEGRPLYSYYDNNPAYKPSEAFFLRNDDGTFNIIQVISGEMTPHSRFEAASSAANQALSDLMRERILEEEFLEVNQEAAVFAQEEQNSYEAHPSDQGIAAEDVSPPSEELPDSDSAAPEEEPQKSSLQRYAEDVESFLAAEADHVLLQAQQVGETLDGVPVFSYPAPQVEGGADIFYLVYEGDTARLAGYEYKGENNFLNDHQVLFKTESLNTFLSGHENFAAPVQKDLAQHTAAVVTHKNDMDFDAAAEIEGRSARPNAQSTTTGYGAEVPDWYIEVRDMMTIFPKDFQGTKVDDLLKIVNLARYRVNPDNTAIVADNDELIERLKADNLIHVKEYKSGIKISKVATFNNYDPLYKDVVASLINNRDAWVGHPYASFENMVIDLRRTPDMDEGTKYSQKLAWDIWRDLKRDGVISASDATKEAKILDVASGLKEIKRFRLTSEFARAAARPVVQPSATLTSPDMAEVVSKRNISNDHRPTLFKHGQSDVFGIQRHTIMDALAKASAHDATGQDVMDTRDQIAYDRNNPKVPREDNGPRIAAQ